MNTFNIEFKNAKDLAKKIAEYNELMNGPVAPVVVEPVKVEVVAEEPKKEPKPVKDEPKQEKPVPGAKVDKEIVENISIEIEEPKVPVTDFDGNVVDLEPTELSVEEPTEEIDYQTYWADFKNWLKAVGQEGIKAALTIFRNHGVQGNPSSENLTPEIINELNALMNK
jgi:putative beta-N-acetylhexosaminidase